MGLILRIHAPPGSDDPDHTACRPEWTCIVHPERLYRLFREQIVPLVRPRPADL